ncbi:MAG: hypothetical protein PVI44_06775 [Balneolaceae bacterium]|jgi:hypothetical protein
MNRFLSFTFLIFLLVTVAKPLAAQEKQANENSLLPEIDPQDIEIRSQFKARFPGLRRQPILGFDPTPRVYQIDPNRTPFMETPEQVVANLPVSQLTRPTPPAYTPLDYSSDINAFGRFGIGSYISPEAQFWGVHRINSKSYIGGDFDYSSSDGHLDNQASSFRFFNANGEYATKLDPKSRLTFDGGFLNSFNQMFDLDAAAGIPDNARKEYGGFNLGAEFHHFQNSISGWNASVNIRYYDATLKNAAQLSGKSQERVYHASLAKRWTGTHVNETFTVKLGAKGGNYENNSISNDNWLTAVGGVKYKRLFDYTINMTADVNLFYISDGFDSKVYFGPSLEIKQPFLDFLSLTIKGSAEPYLTTIEQMNAQNRFLNTNNILRHTYRIRGSAEISLDYASTGTLNFGIQYADYTNYPIFMRTQGGIAAGELFYRVDYADAYQARAYASVAHQIIPEQFWVNGKAYVQTPRIKNGGRIPYEEKVGAHSSIGIRPFNKLTLEAWADYVGSRKTFQANEKLKGFLLLGGQLDLEITDNFGAYIKLVNLLNQNYEVWQGYTERPFQAYGGVTVKL